MASTKYTYSIAADTANAKLAEDALKMEIANSSIVTALDYITRAGDVLDIWMKDALSGGDQTTLTSVVNNHLGITLIKSQPLQSDGKPFFTPDLFPKGDLAVHTGIGDDVTNGVRFAGTVAEVSVATADTDVPVEMQFIESIDLVGGNLFVEGGKLGDYIKYEIYAPATAGVSNPGAGAFNKVDLGGGANIYVPAPLVDGGWDVNLAEKLNANVNFTKAVPVPSSDSTGWFDYDPDTDSLTVNSQQTGSYNLFDFAVTISKHIPRRSLLGAFQENLTVAAVKPAFLLPHWIHKTTVHHGAGTHQLDVAWSLFFGRRVTT